MSDASFTSEQEARLREIAREEAEAAVRRFDDSITVPPMLFWNGLLPVGQDRPLDRPQTLKTEVESNREGLEP